MKSIITIFTQKRKAEKTSDFSRFFSEAKSRDKKRVIKEVIRLANEDQKRLMSR